MPIDISVLGDLGATDSQNYRLYLYVEQIRCETQAQLKKIQAQLEAVKKILNGGES